MNRYQHFLRPANRHAMAIKALDPADWLEIGADHGHQMGERRHLLRERRDEVVAALPGSEEAEDELLALLLDHLQNHARDLYKIEPDAVFEISTGWQVKRQGTPPLARIAHHSFVCRWGMAVDDLLSKV